MYSTTMCTIVGNIVITFTYNHNIAVNKISHAITGSKR